MATLVLGAQQQGQRGGAYSDAAHVVRAGMGCKSHAVPPVKEIKLKAVTG